MRMGLPIMNALSKQEWRHPAAGPAPRLRLAAMAALAVTLSGCASVSIPFMSLGQNEPEPLQTASISAIPPASQPTSLPPELSALTPAQPQSPVASRNVSSPRPAADLISSLPTTANDPMRLTQADLNAMGRALTHVLASDDDPGTFSWSHEPTGRVGLMTPFRQLGSSDEEACRLVSVEITDNGNNVILLADACQQDGAWVFVTPSAGQAL